MESRFHSCDSRGLLALMELSAAPDSELSPASDPSAEQHPPAAPQIEGYQITGPLGAGGMGIVWRAIQLTTRRPVALKVMAQLGGTRKSLARFEREIELAARLEHPHIARVYESGTKHGLNYYAMELVEGIHLDHYTSETKPDQRAILKLMRDVARAVQFAHQRGVIHRDLKPSNILVSSNGEPHIVDFGLAKTTADDLAMTLTQEGHYAGTPAFMSPEQARGEIDNLDTRSDVYSLGATLYLLLTGQTAHDLSGPRYQAIRRIADEDVRRPRLMNTKLDAELEWVLLKALAQNADNRYASAGALADDIDRYLSGEPIDASPPSRKYRLTKFVRRNRAALSVAGAFALVLVIATVVSAWQAVRASLAQRQQSQLRQQAQSEAARSSQVANFMKEMLTAVGPTVARGRDTALLREVLDQTVVRLDAELADQPQVQADLQETLGAVYDDLADNTKAEAILRRSLATRIRLFGPQDASVASVLDHLAGVLHRQSKYTQARVMYQEALAIRRKLLGSSHPDVASTLLNLANSMRMENSRSAQQQAEATAREGLAIRKSLYGDAHLDVAAALSGLGLVLQRALKLDEAEAIQRQALAMYLKLVGKEHPAAAALINNLAVTLTMADKPVEANTLHREALAIQRRMFGGDHRDLTATLRALGSNLIDLGQLDEAETVIQEQLAMARRLMGNDDRFVGNGVLSLAIIYRRQGRVPESEAAFREAIPIQSRFSEYERALYSRTQFAQLLLEQGKFDEAESVLLRGDEELSARADTAEVRRFHAQILQSLAQLYTQWGKTDLAQQATSKAAQFQPATTRPDSGPRQ